MDLVRPIVERFVGGDLKELTLKFDKVDPGKLAPRAPLAQSSYAVTPKDVDAAIWHIAISKVSCEVEEDLVVETMPGIIYEIR
jgi:hypothetical protein